MVDGSNESLYHANEEFDPNLCTGVPLQKSLEIVDVNRAQNISLDFVGIGIPCCKLLYQRGGGVS